MKKLLCLAICAMAVMISCKNKGAAGDAADNDSTAVDSVMAELNDTTPLPMFLYYMNPQYMQIVYWSNEGDVPDAWQDMIRRNAAGYTKMLYGEKWIDIKFLGETWLDPDGKDMFPGELHGISSIPSPGLKYAFANSKDIPKKDDALWGLQLVIHKDYLKTRKQLECECPERETPMPQAIVKKMEQRYGMKAKRSQLITKIGGRYLQGTVQFIGEYKNAPKTEGSDFKKALALNVIADGDSIYSLEVLGYYDEESKTCTWNADDEGEYTPTVILGAFEGPKGLELAYAHYAPESSTVGMYFVHDGKINEVEYACYHNMIDEQPPLWDKELAAMQKLYLKESNAREEYPLKKYYFIDIDNDGIDEVWMRDKDEKIGALFTFRDRKPELIGVETEKMKARFNRSNDKRGSVTIAGPAGGPSYATEVYVLKGSKVVDRFGMMELEGEITDAELNGKTLTKWEAAEFLDKSPSNDNKVDVYFYEKREED